LKVAMRTLPMLLLVLTACTTPAPTPAPAAAKHAESFQVIPLQHSSADELAATLRSLFSRNPDIRVMSDSRTNSLLIAADPQDIERIEALVERIDIEVKPAR
jgi:type II secretory pathway component GspD/PulD (secretin)